MDSITVLRTRKLRLAKLIREDGTSEGYDQAKTLDGFTEPLTDLDAVAALLARLIPKPDCCVVRGQLIGGDHMENIRRLLYVDRKTGEVPTMRDVPRSWVALDLEGVIRPPSLPATDLAGCATVALAAFPATIREASAVIQASANHGVKPDIRLRAWFWLSRPTTGIELKRWLKETPCDKSVFGTVQPIYTAAPVMARGAVDPVPDRLARVDGAGVVVVPPAADLAPPPRAAAPEPRAVMPNDQQAVRYVRSALERAAGAIAATREGNRHALIVAECCRLARFVKAGLLPSSIMSDVVHAASRACGKDDPNEIEAAIAYGLANPWEAGAMPGDHQRG